MLKVLIVDDSALMRRHLRQLLEAEGGIQIAHARNGREALEQLGTFEPQVITLDVNMPEMDGLTCLEQIMQTAPRPVVMVSSETSSGADATLRALALGAIDVVLKPGSGKDAGGPDRLRKELITKVRAAASARARRPSRLRAEPHMQRDNAERRRMPARMGSQQHLDVTLIGVSTGGPRVLEEILPTLPAAFPQAVVVAQHMRAVFTASMARRLNEICVLPVLEVDRPTPLQPGHIYIARGEADVVLERRLGRLIVTSVASDQSPWHPSVTRMVMSALALLPPTALIGVQLTGMGDDGAEAMAQLRANGGRTIAESEDSAAVFGMPGELVRRGGATKILNGDQIAGQLLQWAGMEVKRWGC